MITRIEIARHIVARLKADTPRLQAAFRSNNVHACAVDKVLPVDLAMRIFDAFPDAATMRHRRSIREDKHVAAQMDAYDPLLEEAVFAFQDVDVVDAVSEITGIRSLIPDDKLYAGGISVMTKGSFLNPHLDNSHDADRLLYRAINSLFYVSPDWSTASGGNLEVWDDGPKGQPREFVSAFNRLVLMSTGRESWHSVNKVVADAKRCCVSNYYFASQPTEGVEHFHVTSFRGRPEQPVVDLVLQADAFARNAVRMILPHGAAATTHIYRR
ncbi:2OG-Fe(II) oxygenase [Glacieibacterium megasporae]|uniref:2OG-Fe(II) oxygenase n=1 Tax=Glacieibacterium megasporae TaxID=2835787 RepID=UPI001C1E59EA|nr:2OG-Fe(II) oxygenase [Polymorphobacter megasporae]UAJ09270.1 2OG-Fe(II) oxygenase [Polymorphobacter megasporae]